MWLSLIINTLLLEIATRIMVGFWPKVFEKVGIYGLLADLIKHGALVHGNDKLSDLWHKRYDHLFYGALPHSKDMVQGLANFKIEKIERARVLHPTSTPKLLSQEVGIDQEGLLI